MTTRTHTRAVADRRHRIRICAYHDLLPERGVAVLVGTRQLAVFRTFDGALYALDNRDPYSGAQVLSRGLVGTRHGEPIVISPMHKQVFSLVTGICLDDPETAVATYSIYVTDAAVEVSVV